MPADPFEHPDARRRFRVMADVDELARALEYPWERWTVFLHPAQRELVERRFGGPARIAGSAGTGKTVVALHRAVHLARANPDARVLLTTFSETLANALRIKLARLIGTEPRLRERIDVDALDTVAAGFTSGCSGRAEVASREWSLELIRAAALDGALTRGSLRPSCCRSGRRSSMRGSSTRGRPTATSRGWGGRRGCRRSSGRRSGRSSSGCGPA